MSRVRGKDTQPERALRRELRRAGIRYRSYRVIGGVSVDIAVPKRKLAILVHGCFWHGCRRHYTPPKSNRRFWQRKLAQNRDRDFRQRVVLKRLGWSVRVVWEHDLEETETARRVLASILAKESRLLSESSQSLRSSSRGTRRTLPLRS